MPKIAGINVVAVIVAAIVIYAVGFLWYGVLFSDAWVSAMGYTEAELQESSPAWMAVGFVISLLTAIGLAVALRWNAIASPASAARRAGVLWLFFGLPFCMYGWVYDPAHSTTLLLIDASHLFVGWVAAAIVLSLFRD